MKSYSTFNKTFSVAIISWYKKNKRDLPWRNTKDPYLIWLSEIILQQTRVEQGLPYYLKFAEAFPDIKSFANSREEKLLKVWQGLGYYSRVRNMHVAAKEVVKKCNGKFPNSFEGLLSLKGVGTYTAAAIGSLAFDLPHAVVDGNVYRLLSRYFGIATAIDSTKGKKEFETLANKLLDKKHPGIFNSAMMELGATICKPKNQGCTNCPLQNGCYAFAQNEIQKFPVKSKKLPVRNRWFYYLVITTPKKIYLHQRTGNDIWKNLFDFPLIETKMKTNPEKILSGKAFRKIFGKQQYIITKITNAAVHKLSHQHIHAYFIEIEVNEKAKLHFDSETILIPKKRLHDYAVSKLMEKYFYELT